ncbi:UDP-N-acetylmuramoyl-L-alanyl-D-glutamate--2,6-diaminopimelate ligase [Modestobacter sp. I12A-02628]|uniref:UDP-N-acetylmuramoyl-L-alanyl-D-glutamate--2,6-diaminopimelate ligase n=2 Tax=Goekera deserti TaxID=2497753 RepID=A0A7K3WAE2_9ACTN|nr:UDP-N-acetylmuramoyl-L-alanyl-D-glutamate--2,6-diaminopimelate ligase [Goekera deserti]MPQ97719.1 UDP-N-acetylmuramoyl-L-alanyl-D-glutamate--2,6-diaminopimelate ligase [Goekera deserti]NDI47614.1 UDP-N-acetylmuramoyl-L-alanyl-D-glutamate--2,6-diaminopimelate ligase [Goekera deserti]NDI47677.1 UDP-N-acetylmuramoyl-L-alanyl-D-glutamate--2,6-diaminopimelate ligase [Goekera deserti]NEL53425.1 UDP-N-acetylmuramoyl-L-alanyl-D-glutamate--2,6-diaminopimelate ligase [Goekera deserti]
MSPTAPGSVPRPAGTDPHLLTDLADLVGEPVSGDPATVVSGVTLASTEVRPGDLYAALPGARTHGARFAADAAAAGAAAVLTDPAGRADAEATGLPVCVVDDPRTTLGPVAARLHGEPSHRVPVIGITGTNGKTTTSYLVEAGLAAAGWDSGLIGTVQTRTRGRDATGAPVVSALPSVRTTPEAPALHGLLAGMVGSGVRAVVMEVSSHALVQGRVGGVRFAAAGFTNLSRDHLEFHGDLESYFRAKALLFDGRAAVEVVDVDDPHGRRLVRGDTVTVSTTGTDADWWAGDVQRAPAGGSAFTLHGPGGRSWPARLRLPGGFNVANAVLAVALLDAVGVPVEAALEGIAATVVPGRMEPVDAGQPFVAVVDYAHTPDAVATALAALRGSTPGRLLTVLGCGGDRDPGKRAGMGAAAAAGSDLLVVTDDNPRSEDPALIRAAMRAGADGVPAGSRAEVLEVGDRRAAIAAALARAAPGDTVLVAGKGHETGQEVAGRVLPFDDRTVLRELLERGHATPGGPTAGPAGHPTPSTPDAGAPA